MESYCLFEPLGDGWSHLRENGQDGVMLFGSLQQCYRVLCTTHLNVGNILVQDGSNKFEWAYILLKKTAGDDISVNQVIGRMRLVPVCTDSHL